MNKDAVLMATLDCLMVTINVTHDVCVYVD